MLNKKRILALGIALTIIGSGSAFADPKGKIAPTKPSAPISKPSINANLPLTCPTPAPITGGNGTTILQTTVGTALSSSSFKALAAGNYSYSMSPISNSGGAITFDTNSAVINISATASAGTYSETVTALALDTASVTTNFNVAITVLAPVVIDTRTAMLCLHQASELNEKNEGHESDHGVKPEPKHENNAEFNRVAPKNSTGGNQKPVIAARERDNSRKR